MSGERNKSLYFIAVVPPEPVYREIASFKEESSDLFDSKHALRSPPHITLAPPFRATLEEVINLKIKLERLCLIIDPFPIQLLGFESFSQGVVYVRVVQNEILFNLYKEVRSLVETTGIKGPHWHPSYKPHITVAFKDLQKKYLREALQHFKAKAYSASYLQSNLSLLKHDGKKWRVDQTYFLRHVNKIT